jgi:serine/threonine protein kinase
VLKGTYKLYDKVGSGGFATVYLGRNLRTNQIVAVKVLREEFAEDPGSVERFRREAQLVQRLDHPNIVRVLDYGVEAGQHFLVMDYIEGKTLAQLIRERGPLPVAEAVTYAAQVCEALQVAHRAGVVHRDIKPQNLMVTPEGTLKVMDFGVARLAAMTVLTHSGQSLGTPLYMAPEIASGLPADIRSDIYSLGIVLYQMLAGKVPFEGDSPWTVMRQQIETPPPPLSALRRDLPAWLELIVIKALAKDPSARYQTPTEILAALRNSTNVLPAGARMSVLPQAKRRQSQNKVETRLAGRPQGTKAQTDRGRLRALLWTLGGTVALLALVTVLLVSSRNSSHWRSGKETPEAGPTNIGASDALGDDPTTALVVARLVLTFTLTPTVVWTHTPSPEPSTPTATATLPPTAMFSPTPSSPRVSVAGNSVNVRSGPSTQFPVVGRLEQGQSQEVTGRNSSGEWWQVEFGGQLVWVAGAVVKLVGDLTAVPIIQGIPVPPSSQTPSPPSIPTSAAAGRVIFEGDPRNSAWLCDGGFRSECEFAECSKDLRLVFGPYCRNDDAPAIENGTYRVTIHGNGTVRAGATDFGPAQDPFAFGERILELPGSFSFCWPGRQPNGYGFEIMVQSLGSYASISRITIEYLGATC